MPSNNSNLTSALSRQMQNLRRQVDRIDVKILKLLQQRTKLSRRIGETKRRHRADVYVPERERELLARMNRQDKGRLPARSVTAIYREILSSSRAAQGQAPIGLLHESAGRVLLPGRWCFGACDEFVPAKTWIELAASLEAGSLALALLTGEDLARILRSPQGRRDFFTRFAICGDFPSLPDPEVPLPRQIFIVTSRRKGTPGTANRMLILIECKSTVNAVKSLLHFMPDRPLHAEELTLGAPSVRNGKAAALVRLSLSRPIESSRASSVLQVAATSAGVNVSLLGLYPGPENGG